MRHFALIGDPVAHSLSPLIYGFLFAEYGVDADFCAIRIPKGQVSRALTLGLDGFACTMPHKQDVAPLLCSLSPEAQAMGSVNIVKRVPEGYHGLSTDGCGLLRALSEATAIQGKRVLILGSGGAARAAAYTLKAYGPTTLLGRNASALAKIAQDLGVAALPEERLEEAASAADILINATPRGMTGGPAFASLEFLRCLPASAVVCDMVYYPRETALLSAARERGLTAVEGIGMLVNQAYAAFEAWTGLQPDPRLLNARLYDKIDRELAKRR